MLLSSRKCLAVELCLELLAQIFENLHSGSLKACSLVCRPWLFASRIRLFRRILITPRNINELTAIVIHSPHNTLQPYVREIEIQGHIGTTPLEILQIFSPVLTHLYLRDTVFDTLDILLDVICRFQALQSLVLDGVKYPDPAKFEPDKRVPPPCLNHLCLNSIPLLSFLRWLSFYADTAKISYLEMGPLDEYDANDAGKYTVLINSTLRHLTFSFGYYREVFDMPVCGNLVQLTNLESLNIRGFVDSRSSHQSAALFWSPNVYRSADARKIKSVTLDLTLSSAAEMERYNINWEFLDEVFSGERYRNLKFIRFEIQGRVNLDGITNLLASKLPKANSRGILRIYKVL